MVKPFKAVTKSGAIYEYRDGFMRIKTGEDSRLWDTTVRVWVLQQPSPDFPEDAVVVPWLARDQWLDVEDLPRVGASLYVSGKDEWRVSTPIVSVEELPDDD